ncbi:PAS domain-containing protein [Microvirga sp. 3-52]|uniref:PAS domain-containing protein n=1 Tax=Microvirga sp. 3-52 TaxID=2792425 RepID=UPI001AD174DC|nr:PAS domain-containing protein [Microvirga sp. 3-52]MBO1907740.1 PAS domain-containing protein [Microvirga sp. 3-52]MBS7454486.1 PAS domain-containing protein [Microvirga sp. 3-52]
MERVVSTAVSAMSRAGFEAGWNWVRDRRISVSSRTFSPIANTHVIAVAVRVDDADGRMKGFLTVNLPETRLAAILLENLLPDGWTTTVFDRNHAPAASSDHPPTIARVMPAELRERSGGLGGTASGTGYDAASKSFFAYHRSAQTDFVTGAFVPAALVDAPLAEAWHRIGMIGLVLLLAGGIAGLLVARQVGPVEASAALTARKLHLSEARHASLWNDTPESLFVVTVAAEGRFVFEGLNPAHERATGLRLGMIAGREPHECLPPQAAKAVTGRYRECVARGEPMIYDETLAFPGGIQHWQTCLAQVRDPETGRIITLVGTARDVTADREARAEAERSRGLLQATLDALSAHVAILAGDGTIIAVNQAWRSFGDSSGLADPHHGVGTNYLEVCRAAGGSEPRAAAVARGLAALLDGERPAFRSSYRCGERHFQMTADCFHHEGGTYAVVAHEDVSGLMAARQDVRDIARRLLSLQEEERQRIAADLHDSTAQHLAAVGLALMGVSAVGVTRSAWRRRSTRSGPPSTRPSGRSARCRSCSTRPACGWTASQPCCGSSSAALPTGPGRGRGERRGRRGRRPLRSAAVDPARGPGGPDQRASPCGGDAGHGGSRSRRGRTPSRDRGQRQGLRRVRGQ